MKTFCLLGALVALSTVACSPPPARLTGRWIFLASASAPIAVGQTEGPVAGGPMRLVPGSPAAGACLPPEEYDRMFGEVCPHEPENGPPGSDGDVRWYCHGNLTVRVRLERCERAGRFRVNEVAVASVPLSR